MANTKISSAAIKAGAILNTHIASGAITSGHLSGINTSAVAEGSNLYYTDARADARVALIVDSSPAALNTLNELAAALGDDANFATTVSASIGTKLPLAGGTMTGTLASANPITTSSSISAREANLSYNNSGQYPLDLGNSSATQLVLQRWQTSAGLGKTYIVAYGSQHATEAGNFAIKNVVANRDIYFQLAGSVVPLRLTSTGATFAGNIVVSGTVDGVDVAARDAVLTSTTTTAAAALPKAGGTLTGDVTFATGAELITQTAGSNNFRAGEDAGSSITSGGSNVFVGTEAGKANTSASANAAFGYRALKSNTTGNNNTAFGHSTLEANSTGFANIAMGKEVLKANTTGQNNIGIGFRSLYSNVSGSSNSAFGYESLLLNTTGGGNVALGFRALKSNTTGISNVAFGGSALENNTTGNYNTAVGKSALNSNTSAGYGTAFGYFALGNNTTGINNIAFGINSLKYNTSGQHNSGVGSGALVNNTTGRYNSALGSSTLESNTTAENNSAFGYQSLKYNTTGNENSAVGRESLYSNVSGTQNSAHGMRALRFNTTGSKNTSSGYASLYTNSSGSENTATGHQSGYSLTTGSNNSFYGRWSGYNITTGSKNLILGKFSGNQYGIDIRTSNNNIVLSDGDGNPRLHINSSGAATFASTVNGVDIAARDAVLTSTTTTAGAALPKAGGTMTGTLAMGANAITSTGTLSTGAITGTTATASGGTNTTALASTAFVQQEITTLIGGAPSTLNDLNELAAAINDDANYNSTLTTALATKLPLAGGAMTGNIQLNNAVELRTLDTGGTARTIVRANSSNELEFGWSANAPVKFMGGGSYTERMRIHTNGNVGIGTSAPAEKLHVYSAGASKLLIEGDSTGAVDSVGIRYKSRGTTNWFTGIGSTATGTVSSDFIVSNGTDANTNIKLLIDTVGNVGIGTSSPAAKLQIQGDGVTLKLDGTANTSRQINLRNTGTAEGQIQTDGNMHFIQEDANRYMRFSTANTERMRIDSSGNLLVGKTSASSGTIGFEAKPDGFMAATRSNNTVAIFNRTTADGAILDFRKDGTTVGSIGTVAGAPYYAGVSKSLRIGSAGFYPATNTGAYSDATIDLGYSGGRYKDLHLSGTANVGSLSTYGETVLQDGATGFNALRLRRVANGGGSGVKLMFTMQNSASEDIDYASITPIIQNATDGNESGYIGFATMKDGANSNAFRIGHETVEVLAGHNFSVTGTTTGSGYLYLSSKTANQGLRLNNTTKIQSWNAAGTVLRDLMELDANEDVRIGSSANDIYLDSNTNVTGNLSMTGSTLTINTGSTASLVLDSGTNNSARQYFGNNGTYYATIAAHPAGDPSGTGHGIALCAGSGGGDVRFGGMNVGENVVLIGGLFKNTTLECKGEITVTGAASVAVAGEGKYSATGTNGAQILGNGSTNDVVIGRRDGAVALRVPANTVNVVVNGALSKGSGSFRIDHPLKPETHELVHSFTESPQADLLYSGVSDLVDGAAEINLDEFHDMTEGTFVALNRNIRVFTTNETDWEPIKGSVTGNILSISCQDASCSDTVSWLVIGERHDEHMMDTNWTDEEGRVIVEPLKPEEPGQVQRTLSVPVMLNGEHVEALETVKVPESIEVIDGVAVLTPATTKEILRPKYEEIGVVDLEGNPVYE